MESKETFNGVFVAEKVATYWRDQYPKIGSGKYTDPYFPPNEASLLGKDSNGNFIDLHDGCKNGEDLHAKDIEWKRAEEIFNGKYLLFDDKIEFSDIKQGDLGNCYFLSAIAALTELPSLIYQIFRTKEVNKNGIYEIVLFVDGHWRVVFVDDYFPVKKGTNILSFARPNGNELWVLILEKAWAKINGGYANIIRGWPSDPLAAMTGFATQKLNHKDMELEELWKTLLKADQNDNIMCTSTKNDGSVEKFGIVVNHAYTLIGAKETIFTFHGRKLRLIRIRNPWGYKEWNGDWSDKSPLWTDEIREICDYKDADDGTFWICLEDFISIFECTHVCHVMFDSNVRSFHLKGENVVRPHVFNLLLDRDSKVAISIITKHWRYNRELKLITHPISIVIGKYNPKTNVITEVDGEYAAYEYLECIKDLTKGFYVIWVYCAYQYAKEPKPNEILIRFVSPIKYKVRHINEDSSFEFIKHLIISGVKEKIQFQTDTSEQYIGVENSFKRTGLGYRVIINKSPTIYQKWTNDQTEMQKCFMLPPFTDKPKFEFFVPPAGETICLGMRDDQWGQYWFNLKSTYLSYQCQPGEDPTKTKKISLDNFLSSDVIFDDVDDNYYDYISTSLKESKKDIKFQHINTTEIIIDELRKQHPQLMDILISLDPIQGDENLKWCYQKYDNGYYVGQINEGKNRQGRGAYNWINDHIIYAGYWVNNVREIYGKILDDKYKVTYAGKYKNGLKNGKGKFWFSNGDTYEGDFVNDKRHGKGLYVWSDGSRWDGPQINSQMHGTGMYYPNDGTEPWEVAYENGQYVG